MCEISRNRIVSRQCGVSRHIKELFILVHNTENRRQSAGYRIQDKRRKRAKGQKDKKKNCKKKGKREKEQKGKRAQGQDGKTATQQNITK